MKLYNFTYFYYKIEAIEGENFKEALEKLKDQGVILENIIDVKIEELS